MRLNQNNTIFSGFFHSACDLVSVKCYDNSNLSCHKIGARCMYLLWYFSELCTFENRTDYGSIDFRMNHADYTQIDAILNEFTAFWGST